MPIMLRAGKRSESRGCAQYAWILKRILCSLWPPGASCPVASEKNGPLNPKDVLPGSHRSVWWKCSEGHEWRAKINSRVEGNGCPICAGRVVIPGKNDLETVSPLLAAQWHPNKNGPLSPGEVTSGSKRKVWWRCVRGHEWQASIKSRTQGAGCPVCAGKTPRVYK